MRNIHIDTCLVFAYVWGEGDEYQWANRLFTDNIHSDVSNNHIELKMSQLVVGEMISNYFDDDFEYEIGDEIGGGSYDGIGCRECTFERLFKLINRYEIDLIPPTKECYDLSFYLLDNDRELENNDALLVSQALKDPLSSRFITQDDILLYSRTIKEKADYLRDNGERKRDITITDEYGGS